MSSRPSPASTRRHPREEQRDATTVAPKRTPSAASSSSSSDTKSLPSKSASASPRPSLTTKARSSSGSTSISASSNSDMSIESDNTIDKSKADALREKILIVIDKEKAYWAQRNDPTMSADPTGRETSAGASGKLSREEVLKELQQAKHTILQFLELLHAYPHARASFSYSNYASEVFDELTEMHEDLAREPGCKNFELLQELYPILGAMFLAFKLAPKYLKDYAEVQKALKAARLQKNNDSAYLNEIRTLRNKLQPHLQELHTVTILYGRLLRRFD